MESACEKRQPGNLPGDGWMEMGRGHLSTCGHSMGLLSPPRSQLNWYFDDDSDVGERSRQN
jgi:hypothetical protein